MMFIICIHEKSKSLISVLVQNVCVLNCTSIHIESRKKSWKETSVSGIGIFQEKLANSMVSDALGHHIHTSSVAMVHTK